MRYILQTSLVLVSFSLSLLAQEEADSLEMDSVKIEFELMPKSFRAGMDLVGLVRTLTESDHAEFDFTSDIAIDKFLLNFDYGLLDKKRIGNEINYHVSGNFFRVGIDFNVLKKDPDGNAFFFGVKYGRGKSDHSLMYTYNDPIFGEYSDAREFNSVNVRWYELNSGVKVKLFWEIWAGFTGRLKFAAKYDHSIELSPYELPGYGFADRKFNWGFDYYLFYRIPFAKKKKEE